MFEQDNCSYLWLNFSCFKKRFFYFYLCIQGRGGGCARECRCALKVGGLGVCTWTQVCSEARKWQPFLCRGWCHRWLWASWGCWELNSLPLQEQEAIPTDKLSLKSPCQAFHCWETESKQIQTLFQLRNSAKTFPPSLLSPAGNVRWLSYQGQLTLSPRGKSRLLHWWFCCQ